MENDRTPLLWVTGPPGTGKSTTGWGLFTRISEGGGSVAHVDIDQLGLIGPPRGGGAAAHAIKADNLLRVAGTLRRRGVQQVVVSGVVDPELGIDPLHVAQAETVGLDVTLVRLRCAPDELRRRFLGRGSPGAMLAELLDVADAFDRSDIGELLDTTGQHPRDTVSELVDRCVVRPGPAHPLPAVGRDHALPPAPVVVVTGATAVGKSTATWSVLGDLWQRGVPTAYIDLAQLGFVHPGPDPVLQTACLGALWRGYRHAGAEALLVVARDPEPVRRAFPDDLVTVVRMDADGPTLTDRIRRRAAGESALLAGDELRGAPPAVQQRVAARAAAEADHLRRTVAARTVLDTTGQEPDETAAAVFDAIRPVLGPLVPGPAPVDEQRRPPAHCP